MSDTSMPSSLCRTFASTLGGTAEVVNGVCTVTRIRSNLKPLIQGRKTNSALALAALFSFESFDSRGNALNLGETVILQEEINPFISELRNRGIEVTAVHNHWLFDNPRLMYIHFKSVEPPLTFANKVAAAFKVLTSRTVGPNTTSGSRGSNGSNGSRGSNSSQGSNGSQGSRGLQGSSQRQYGYICSSKTKKSNAKSEKSRTSASTKGLKRTK